MTHSNFYFPKLYCILRIANGSWISDCITHCCKMCYSIIWPGREVWSVYYTTCQTWHNVSNFGAYMISAFLPLVMGFGRQFYATKDFVTFSFVHFENKNATKPFAQIFQKYNNRFITIEYSYSYNIYNVKLIILDNRLPYLKLFFILYTLCFLILFQVSFVATRKSILSNINVIIPCNQNKQRFVVLPIHLSQVWRYYNLE